MKTDGVRGADDDDDDDDEDDDFDEDIDRDSEDASGVDDADWRDVDRRPRMVGVADRDGDAGDADARGTDAERSGCGCNFDCDCCDCCCCCDCGGGGCDPDVFLATSAVGFAAGWLRGSMRDGLGCADDERDCEIDSFAFADDASLVDTANLEMAVDACCFVVLAADIDEIDAL